MTMTHETSTVQREARVVKTKTRAWLVLRRTYSNGKITFVVYEPAQDTDPDKLVYTFPETGTDRWRLYMLPLSSHKTADTLRWAMDELDRVSKFREPFGNKSLTASEAGQEAVDRITASRESTDEDIQSSHIDIEQAFAEHSRVQEQITRPIVIEAFPEAQEARCDQGLYYRIG